MIADLQTLYPYPFPLHPIPRIPFDSANLKQYLSREEPVVIEGSKLVDPALGKWDLDYLTANLGDKGLYNVMQAKGHQRFKFFDLKKVNQLKGRTDFELEISTEEMTFREFVKRYYQL